MWGRKRAERRAQEALEVEKNEALERTRRHDAEFQARRAAETAAPYDTDAMPIPREAAHEAHRDAENLWPGAETYKLDVETPGVENPDEAWADDESQTGEPVTVIVRDADGDVERVTVENDQVVDRETVLPEGDSEPVWDDGAPLLAAGVEDPFEDVDRLIVVWGPDARRVLIAETDVVVHSLASEEWLRSRPHLTEAEEIRGAHWPVGGLFRDLRPEMHGTRLFYVERRTEKGGRPAFQVVNLVHFYADQVGVRSEILAHRLLAVKADGAGRWFEPLSLPEAE